MGHSPIGESIQSLLFSFKQKTAYELRISDWSSDVLLFRSPLLSKSPTRRRDKRSARFNKSSNTGLICGGLQPKRRPVVEPGDAKLERYVPYPVGGSLADGRVRPWRGRNQEPRWLSMPSSEERRVGNKCVSTGRSGWSRDH